MSAGYYRVSYEVTVLRPNANNKRESKDAEQQKPRIQTAIKIKTLSKIKQTRGRGRERLQINRLYFIRIKIIET